MVALNWSGYKKLTSEGIEDLPTFAGVYKLATHNAQTEKYKPFYVGQTGDIKARIQQHVSPSEPNSCIRNNVGKYWTYVNYASVSSQADRDTVEVALYNHYKPECNDPNVLPGVEPADVSSFN